MKFKLYQIAPEEEHCALMFHNFKESAKERHVDSSHYECVYDGELDTKYVEIIFTKFNTALPSDYHGRCMSVSDVLEIEKDGGSQFLFCDSYGFEECEFDTSKVLPTAESRKQK